MIRNIVAVVSGMDEEYPYHIISGINDYVRENDLNISYFAAFGGIVDSQYFDAGEHSIYCLPDFSRYDGVLLLTNTFSNSVVRNHIINRVQKSGTPTVIFECKDYEEFHDISIDNYSVMKSLVEHLIRVHGVRVFNFVAGPASNPEAKERYRAFRDVLEEHGIEFDERRFYQGLFRSYDGLKAIESFMETGLEMPDAFVCANDSMALTVMDTLKRLGYSVPRDIIVTGFDHTFNAQNSFPTLTTVKRPLYYSGRKSCSILLDLMNGTQCSKSTVLEAEAVFAQSCGCDVSNNGPASDFMRSSFERLSRTYIGVHILNRLIAGLAGARNIEDCVNAIEQMVKNLKIRHFSLCLTEDWESAHHTLSFTGRETTLPDYMVAVMIWDNGERKGPIRFPGQQLFPEPLTTGGNVSYFIPLHFDERYLGYYIISNDDFPIYSLLCHTITMSIGNAIDNVSKLNILDPLCKVYNRNGFMRMAEEVFQSCAARKTRLMLSFIDMDGLKSVNDQYGHQEGDFAIQQMADAISSCCRGKTDLCARIGGDEFVVLCPDILTEDGSFFEKRLVKRLDDLNARISKPYQITASIGSVVVIPSPNDRLSDLIKEADANMYIKKKERKRNRGL